MSTAAVDERPSIQKIVQDEIHEQTENMAKNALKNPISELFNLFSLTNPFHDLKKSCKNAYLTDKCLSDVKKYPKLKDKILQKELKRLEKSGEDDLKRIFSISKKQKLPKKLKTLRDNIENEKEQSLEEAEKTVKKLRNRAIKTLACSLFDLIGKITFVAGAILTIVVPTVVPLGAALMGVGATLTCVGHAQKWLFTNKKPFDPNERTPFVKILENLHLQKEPPPVFVEKEKSENEENSPEEIIDLTND